MTSTRVSHILFDLNCIPISRFPCKSYNYNKLLNHHNACRPKHINYTDYEDKFHIYFKIKHRNVQ